MLPVGGRAGGGSRGGGRACWPRRHVRAASPAARCGLRRRACSTRSAACEAVSSARAGCGQAARGRRGAGGGRTGGGRYKRAFGMNFRLRRRVRLSVCRLFCRLDLFSDVEVRYLSNIVRLQTGWFVFSNPDILK
ncbi:unnamed protein product [Euphydryas editha]|uniref:Uncharacterized protein n=1 Tax=Euphydryas editha TaxID=104508 RepID=A0AAU9TGA0_EUPED|nr:unnamed protein product [Euphydryas editha]